MSRNFISRKTQILCSQTDLLCSTLKMLKERSDSGHGTAGRIWNSLIDGISAEIPEEVFAEEAESYQCEPGKQEGENDQAFKKILDKAVLKKAQGKARTTYDQNHAQVPETVSAQGVESSEGKMVPGSPKKVNEKLTEDEQHEKEIDNLLLHLIDMLRVAVERTELSYWDWKKEDDALKLDIEGFNKNLKTSLNLVKNVQSSLTESSLMKATENFSMNDAANVFELMKNSVAALEFVRPVNPISSEVSSYDFSDDVGDDDGDDDDSEDIAGADEDEVVNSNATTEPESGVDSSKSKETGKTPEDCKNHLCSEHSSHAGYAPKYEVPKPGTPRYETFIVRHAKKSTRTTIKAIRNPPCDHTGYVFPTAHYRDWKRDGFRCMCGQKFRFLNAMDKHIYIQQEARMLYCDECNYKISRKCCMDNHKKSCHEKPKMLRACRRLYQCMFGCDQLLKSKKELYDHQIKTDRQCLYLNAGKLPAKYLPPNASTFILGLKNTFENAKVALTVDKFDKVLNAAMADAMRIKNAGVSWDEVKITLAFKVKDDVVGVKIITDK